MFAKLSVAALLAAGSLMLSMGPSSAGTPFTPVAPGASSSLVINVAEGCGRGGTATDGVIASVIGKSTEPVRADGMSTAEASVFATGRSIEHALPGTI